MIARIQECLRMLVDLLLMVQNKCPIVIRILCPAWRKVDRAVGSFWQAPDGVRDAQGIAVAALARIVVAHEQIRRARVRLMVEIQIDAPLPHAGMIDR